ncbi:MAG: cellulase family glycosylhydrolase [Chitinophagaceae bacterium]|nr:cellulase family glycosylhydrolase [Chitinophagaceae bacterium]
MKKLFAIAILSLLIVLGNLSYISAQTIEPKYGITLCGAEFGEHNLPGTLNIDYTYPTTTDIDYFVAKGVDLIQLPIKWERIQRVLGGDLEQSELFYIHQFIKECKERNIQVNIVLQNFGKYRINCVDYIVGESEVTAWHLKDFWVKMALALKSHTNIYAYSIMAEPSDMQSCIWQNTLQYVINGIRSADRTTHLLIEGNNYSNAATWVSFNDELKYLQDPSNKLLFNAHCYFDADFSGRYKKNFIEDGASLEVGVERVKPFIEWLQKNNLNGFIGEFGVPKNDENWLATMYHFLSFIHSQKIGGCYWAAGQWWKDYQLSIQPEKNFNDQPQLQLFSKYFNKNQGQKESSIKPIWARLLSEKKLLHSKIEKA